MIANSIALIDVMRRGSAQTPNVNHNLPGCPRSIKVKALSYWRIAPAIRFHKALCPMTMIMTLAITIPE